MFGLRSKGNGNGAGGNGNGTGKTAALVGGAPAARPTNYRKGVTGQPKAYGRPSADGVPTRFKITGANSPDSVVNATWFEHGMMYLAGEGLVPEAVTNADGVRVYLLDKRDLRPRPVTAYPYLTIDGGQLILEVPLVYSGGHPWAPGETGRRWDTVSRELRKRANAVPATLPTSTRSGADARKAVAEELAAEGF